MMTPRQFLRTLNRTSRRRRYHKKKISSQPKLSGLILPKRSTLQTNATQKDKTALWCCMLGLRAVASILSLILTVVTVVVVTFAELTYRTLDGFRCTVSIALTCSLSIISGRVQTLASCRNSTEPGSLRNPTKSEKRSIQENPTTEQSSTPFNKHAVVERARYDHQMRYIAYADGSLAHVPAGHCPLVAPQSYTQHYEARGRSFAEAQQAWKCTQEWRRQQSVGTILTQPLLMPGEYRYPVYLHGTSKHGFPVVYEPTAQIDLTTCSGDSSAVTEALLRQFVMQLEYMANVLCSNQNGSSSSGFVYVMDIKGVGMTHLSNACLKLRALEVLAKHYPGCCHHVVVVNVPNWLKPMAPTTLPSVQRAGAQLRVLTEAETLSGLTEYISIDQIPPELGGSNQYRIGLHPMDLAFQDLLVAPADTGIASSSDKFDGVTLTSNRSSDAVSSPHERDDPSKSSDSSRLRATSLVVSSRRWASRLVRFPRMISAAMVTLSPL